MIKCWIDPGSILDRSMDRPICWGGSRVGRGGGTDRQTTDRQTTDTNLSRSDPPSNAPRDEIGRGSPPLRYMYECM